MISRRCLDYSALSKASKNTPYAELGIMATSTRNRPHRMKTYTADQKLELHHRSTRVIADRLAVAHLYTRPTLRCWLAYDTAREILQQAENDGALETLERSLEKLERPGQYEI